MFIVTLAAFVASFVVSSLGGTPKKLPNTALDSTLLFVVERGLLLFAVYLVVAVVIQRSWKGELPSEFSGQGLKYSVSEVKDATADFRDETLTTLDELTDAGDRARRQREEIVTYLGALQGSTEDALEGLADEAERARRERDELSTRLRALERAQE